MAPRHTRNMPAGVVEAAAGGSRIALSGAWVSGQASACEAAAAELLDEVGKAGRVVIDTAGMTRMDTLGAWVVSRLASNLRGAGVEVAVQADDPSRRILLGEVQYRPLPEKPGRREEMALTMLTDIGRTMVSAWEDLAHGVGFLGAFMASLGAMFTGRSRFRFTALVTQLERVGLRSVPIIVLISVIVGAIIAQQSVFQLRTFGTVHFVADLLGVLVLRELAVLITAIIIAGRTGSSFTAELGSMKMREEIDALRTMGLDPIAILVAPRILALIIGLPLLTFISSMAMLFGGGVVALVYGGVSPETFLSRLQNGIAINTFVVGLVKAPFMALVVGLIACIEGFAVAGSAESLGNRTTSSVVKAIFMVIIVDGLFAMFFAAIKY